MATNITHYFPYAIPSLSPVLLVPNRVTCKKSSYSLRSLETIKSNARKKKTTPDPRLMGNARPYYELTGNEIESEPDSGAVFSRAHQLQNTRSTTTKRQPKLIGWRINLGCGRAGASELTVFPPLRLFLPLLHPRRSKTGHFRHNCSMRTMGLLYCVENRQCITGAEKRARVQGVAAIPATKDPSPLSGAGHALGKSKTHGTGTWAVDDWSPNFELEVPDPEGCPEAEARRQAMTVNGKRVGSGASLSEATPPGGGVYIAQEQHTSLTF
ncbi:unnamed protein product [Caenorhabditis auriculariae]|uniref:Uncharacterized protein n=1 Tax=Caenorhabditis auriculariae TaxID=2777116 RepID=A0A8S1H5Y1_9PELO|nr:unnamed protein product [Caenorhabditis auriculariae]